MDVTPNRAKTYNFINHPASNQKACNQANDMLRQNHMKRIASFGKRIVQISRTDRQSRVQFLADMNTTTYQ